MNTTKTGRADDPAFPYLDLSHNRVRAALTSLPGSGLTTMYGMPVIFHPNMPRDTIELHDRGGRIVGKIYNIGLTPVSVKEGRNG